jgi:hypothetical protein
MTYVILSLKHSQYDDPYFWKDNALGYTNNPFAAGRYTEEQIKLNPQYYSDGGNAIAIPISNAGIASIGLKCSIDEKSIDKLLSQIKVKE